MELELLLFEYDSAKRKRQLRHRPVFPNPISSAISCLPVATRSKTDARRSFREMFRVFPDGNGAI